jgi:glycine cleavage system regulatory protein
MKQLVATVIGPDQPGIVEQLSQLALNHHANWLGSSMSELAGQFAGIFELAVPDESFEPLTRALQTLDNLHVSLAEGRAPLGSTSARQLRLTITGNDRPGIIRQVSRQTRALDANILTLNTRCQSAPNWGVPLFIAELTVALPAGLEAHVLKDTLEQLADDLMVDLASNDNQRNG